MDRSTGPATNLDPRRFDAALFDLDGVLTATAKVHAAAWKAMFDAFLRDWSDTHAVPYQPFEIDPDYRVYVDGKPRLDGVRSFLASRAIELPEGGPDDPPDRLTLWGLGNRKNELVMEAIQDGGVEVYEGSIRLVRFLREKGLKTAVVTSSRNCELVLRVSGIRDLFDAIVDGVRAAAEGLPGKPAPDTFLRGAALLGVEPARAVVFEDALAGVAAGRAGRFGLVVGVDREGDPDALRRSGADVVVSDLAELIDTPR